MENNKVRQKQPINNPQNNQSNQINQINQPNKNKQSIQINQPKQNKQKNAGQLNKKLSQKIKKKDNNSNCQSKQKLKVNNGNVQSGNGKVIFNLKNNYTEKFYCPQMAIAKITKPQDINLESIPDLPEIPLDTLFGNQ
jgi:hypothetical protein